MAVNQEFRINKLLSNAKKLSTQGRFNEAIDIYNSVLEQLPHNSAAKKSFENKQKITGKHPRKSQSLESIAATGKYARYFIWVFFHGVLRWHRYQFCYRGLRTRYQWRPG